MMHAKKMQLQHWAIIMEGRFDETYEASVTKIGEVHNKLGLEPRWYIGGYNALVSGLVNAIAQRMTTGRFDRGGPWKEGHPADSCHQGGDAGHGFCDRGLHRCGSP